MDFVIDGAKLKAVQEDILQKSMEVDYEVGSVYGALDAMGDGWKSSSYSAFIERMEEFRMPLNDVALAMMAYAVLLAEVSLAVQLFQQEVENSLNMVENLSADDGGIADVSVDASFTKGVCTGTACSPRHGMSLLGSHAFVVDMKN